MRQGGELMSGYKRHIDDIEGMTQDIEDQLHNMSKSELIDWIMELNFRNNMSDQDLIDDYKAFYGDIYEN